MDEIGFDKGHRTEMTTLADASYGFLVITER